MLQSTTNKPAFLFDDLPLQWQMTRWERYGFESILRVAKPKVALEIGTYKGGSLQIIMQHAAKAYSVDVDATIEDRLGSRFPSVEFSAGDSREILPPLLDRISGRGEELGFVLIDGDHSTEGVRSDINAVLRYKPLRPVFIVFHDSFHPPCREGILAADWAACEYVHFVEIDFVPGVYHFEAFEMAMPRSMFGGLAVAVMRPERREGPLTVRQSQKGLFETVFAASRHANTRKSLWDRVLKRPRDSCLTNDPWPEAHRPRDLRWGISGDIVFLEQRRSRAVAPAVSRPFPGKETRNPRRTAALRRAPCPPSRRGSVGAAPLRIQKEAGDGLPKDIAVTRGKKQTILAVDDLFRHTTDRACDHRSPTTHGLDNCIRQVIRQSRRDEYVRRGQP